MTTDTLNPKSLDLLDTIAREYAEESTLSYLKHSHPINYMPKRHSFGQLRHWVRLSWGAYPLPDRFIANRYGHYVRRWYEIHHIRPLPGKLEAYAQYWERVAEIERLRYGLNYPVEYWFSQEVRDMVALDPEAAYDALLARESTKEEVC